jgi:two-component system cell cycle response regulator CtrA
MAGRGIKKRLEAEGFLVEATDTGEDGIEIAKLYDFDAILLASNLPDISGLKVLRSLRNSRIDTPVLFISERSTVDEKLESFYYGADDFLTTPLNDRELIARLKTIIRRAHSHSHAVIRTGKLALDLVKRTAEIEGSRIDLTETEYRILELLALRKGRVVTKETILDHLYGGIDEPMSRTIDVFMCKIRKKLTQIARGENYVETVWGRGFMLRDREAAGAVAALSRAA